MTLTKFSIVTIVKSQLASMRSFGSSKTNFREVLFLFAIPLFVPAAQFFSGVNSLSADVIATVVSAASIFAGLLLNLLVLLYSFVTASENVEISPMDASTEVQLVHQTFNNVSFAIVVSVALVAFALATQLQHPFIVRPSEFLVYYFGTMLLLLVLQILKRVHALMEFRINLKTRTISKTQHRQP